MPILEHLVLQEGNSLDKFLEIIKQNSLCFSVTENYTAEVWKRQQAFIHSKDSWPSYEKDNCYPLLTIHFMVRPVAIMHSLPKAATGILYISTWQLKAHINVYSNGKRDDDSPKSNLNNLLSKMHGEHKVYIDAQGAVRIQTTIQPQEFMEFLDQWQKRELTYEARVENHNHVMQVGELQQLSKLERLKNAEIVQSRNWKLTFNDYKDGNNNTQNVMGIYIKHDKVSSAVVAPATTNVLLPVFLPCPWVLVS
ncbi:hypothetical protein CFP56_024062 [Quercus suber]|uniref:Uncharacterized protein n=1 Tax=Quercus suber TaxID=58331 RepID=A0AAW0K785_QUESU